MHRKEKQPIHLQALLWEIWQETILPGQKQRIFIKLGIIIIRCMHVECILEDTIVTIMDIQPLILHHPSNL
jgi:hypothetical protein